MMKKQPLPFVTRSLQSHSPPSRRLLSKIVAKVTTLIATLLILPGVAESSQQLNRNVSWPGITLSGAPCYGQGQGYGPYDYVTEKAKIKVVEEYHFSREVEQLIRGKSARVGGDLDYTLRAVPNHHRALWAMARYYIKLIDERGWEWVSKHERVGHGTTPAECYFQRAKAFAPNDGTVPAIFGIYLHRRGAFDAALAEYQLAEKLNPKQAELMYNMGLLYLDLNEIAKAEKYAERAKALGYPLTGLQRRISTSKSTSDTD